MTQTTSSLPRLRIGDPASLLALVPYLLGFQPSASLVLVALGEGGRVALSARVDLPVGLPDAGSRSLREAAAQLGRAAARSGGRSAVLVLYLPTAPVPEDVRWQRVAATLTGGVSGAGLRSLDVLAVAGRRWWSLVCQTPDCCPSAGTPMPEVGTSAAEVAAVAAGLVNRGSRDDLVRLLAPGDKLLRAEVRAALARLARSGRSTERPDPGLLAVEAALQDERAALSSATAANLIVAVEDIRVRDAVLVRTPGPDADRAVRLWIEVVQLAPDDRLAPGATLLAAAAYQTGDGALAGLALERALGADPHYYLASLLMASLSAGIPPQQLFDGLAGASAKARSDLLSRPQSGSADQLGSTGA